MKAEPVLQRHGAVWTMYRQNRSGPSRISDMTKLPLASGTGTGCLFQRRSSLTGSILDGRLGGAGVKYFSTRAGAANARIGMELPSRKFGIAVAAWSPGVGQGATPT